MEVGGTWTTPVFGEPFLAGPIPKEGDFVYFFVHQGVRCSEGNHTFFSSLCERIGSLDPLEWPKVRPFVGPEERVWIFVGNRSPSESHGLMKLKEKAPTPWIGAETGCFMRSVRKAKALPRLGEVEIFWREEYGGFGQNPNVKAIRALALLGLMHGCGRLDVEVGALAGVHCARKRGKPLVRSSMSPGMGLIKKDLLHETGFTERVAPLEELQEAEVVLTF